MHFRVRMTSLKPSFCIKMIVLTGGWWQTLSQAMFLLVVACPVLSRLLKWYLIPRNELPFALAVRVKWLSACLYIIMMMLLHHDDTCHDAHINIILVDVHGHIQPFRWAKSRAWGKDLVRILSYTSTTSRWSTGRAYHTSTDTYHYDTIIPCLSVARVMRKWHGYLCHGLVLWSNGLCFVKSCGLYT